MLSLGSFVRLSTLSCRGLHCACRSCGYSFRYTTIILNVFRPLLPPPPLRFCFVLFLFVFVCVLLFLVVFFFFFFFGVFFFFFFFFFFGGGGGGGVLFVCCCLGVTVQLQRTLKPNS